MWRAGVRLGELLLALDTTMVRLVDAPRGLDLPVASSALIVSDDVRLGLAKDAGSADVYFLLGLSDDEAQRWMAGTATGPAPIAVFVKAPSEELTARAAQAGIAVVAVEPQARWERLYRLVNHVFDHHRSPLADPRYDSGTDLFGLAQSIADRVHGMVSIEDDQSRVLAYSASDAEADELRRLSIMGRAGPPEHLEWISRAGIFDALRAGSDVVHVGERPELKLRPRLAIGIHQPPADARHPPVFAGVIWVQRGSQPFADDAEEILRGGAVLAARIMSRLAARPSTHTLRVQQLLGLADSGPLDVSDIARELDIPPGGSAALIGVENIDRHPRFTDIVALSANAFRADAQVTSRGSRTYVLLPQAKAESAASWIRGTMNSLRSELGLQLRAVIATPIAGLAAAAAARAEVDRVLDSAGRHPDSIGQVMSPAEVRTTVLVDEIVTMVGADQRLVDPRIPDLRARHPALADTLRVYLDSFGDIASAAQQLHVHPNTVRYRIRRLEELLCTSLADADVRLVFSLSLRATQR